MRSRYLPSLDFSIITILLENNLDYNNIYLIDFFRETFHVDNPIMNRNFMNYMMMSLNSYIHYDK